MNFLKKILKALSIIICNLLLLAVLAYGVLYVANLNDAQPYDVAVPLTQEYANAK